MTTDTTPEPIEPIAPAGEPAPAPPKKSGNILRTLFEDLEAAYKRHDLIDKEMLMAFLRQHAFGDEEKETTDNPPLVATKMETGAVHVGTYPAPPMDNAHVAPDEVPINANDPAAGAAMRASKIPAEPHLTPFAPISSASPIRTMTESEKSGITTDLENLKGPLLAEMPGGRLDNLPITKEEEKPTDGEEIHDAGDGIVTQPEQNPDGEATETYGSGTEPAKLP